MKHLKKDTGGYALLYVLVIVMVLVAISMMICTVALRNLQSQQAAVERMADKYAAQGEIEKIKVQKSKNLSIDLGTNGSKENAKATYVSTMCSEEPSEESLVYSAVDGHPEQLMLTLSGRNTKITAVLEVKGVKIESYLVETTDPTTNQPTTETHYKLKEVSTSFTSYTIETTGGDAG